MVETDLDDEVRRIRQADAGDGKDRPERGRVSWWPKCAPAACRKRFLPLQSGVGDIANSVLGALGRHPEIPAFEMYTEVVQDSVVRLHRRADAAASPRTCSLTLSRHAMRRVTDNLNSSARAF